MEKERETGKELFRKKSLDSVSSPEDLNDYVKVSNPGVWMILLAIIVLLAGVCVWGVFGKMESKVDVVAVAENNKVQCYVKEENISAIEDGMTVTINGEEYSITSIIKEPIAVSEDMDEYTRHIGNLKIGEWIYTVNIDANLEDGTYDAAIITESISPMKFIMN